MGAPTPPGGGFGMGVRRSFSSYCSGVARQIANSEGPRWTPRRSRTTKVLMGLLRSNADEGVSVGMLARISDELTREIHIWFAVVDHSHDPLVDIVLVLV